MLEIEGLTKDFATRVLDRVDLTFHRGEIHALLGANGAGKSTLCKIVAGLYSPTAGRMRLDGLEYVPKNKQQAEEQGVQIVQQELNLIQNLDVAQNLFLKSLPNRLGWIRKSKLYRDAQLVLSRYGLMNIDPRAQVSKLGIGHQQMLEIASNLERKCKVLILDEPTAALSVHETSVLFDKLSEFKRNGVAIIYISHRLEEVRRIADRVSVLRDGRWLNSSPVELWDLEKTIRDMAGRDSDKESFRGEGERETGTKTTANRLIQSRLRISHWKVRDGGGEIDFELKPGEILGIAGLVGAGRSSLLKSIFGARKAISGELRLEEKKYDKGFRSPAQAVENGVGFISEDRKTDGLLLALSIRDNISINSLTSPRTELQSWGMIHHRRLHREVQRLRTEYEIKSDHIFQTIGQLSGGNQQKSLFARWKMKGINVLLLDEPTRGIDMASRRLIYDSLMRACGEGLSILVSSSDLEELMMICHRIGVMSNGKWTGIFEPKSTNLEELTKAMFAGFSETERSC